MRFRRCVLVVLAASCLSGCGMVNTLTVETTPIKQSTEVGVCDIDNLDKNFVGQEKLSFYYDENEINQEEVDAYYNWMDILNTFEKYANEINLTQEQKLTYIRGQKYNSVYWGELLAYDDTNINAQMASYSPEFETLRRETIICIPNTNISLKTVHTMASIECMKAGLGSFGAWKGDLAELARDIENDTDIDTYDEAYEYAYAAMCSVKESGCGHIDINSDITAVNIGMNMTDDEDVSTAIEYYASYIPYFNQYAVFIKNEFGKEDVSKSDLRRLVKKSMDSDILVEYLLRSFNGYNETIHPAVYDAFADYIYDSLDGKSVNELIEGLSLYQPDDKRRQVQREYSKAQTKKYKALLERYISDVNLAELYDKFNQ